MTDEKKCDCILCRRGEEFVADVAETLLDESKDGTISVNVTRHPDAVSWIIDHDDHFGPTALLQAAHNLIKYVEANSDLDVDDISDIMEVFAAHDELTERMGITTPITSNDPFPPTSKPDPDLLN